MVGVCGTVSAAEHNEKNRKHDMSVKEGNNSVNDLKLYLVSPFVTCPTAAPPRHA